MDVSKYEFLCQKALHQALQYARSLGHQLLEVEHVALALLRAETVELADGLGERLKRHIENHLARAPRIYGRLKVEFGRRLDAALDAAEAQALRENILVKEALLWAALCRQSTVIQTFLSRHTEEAQQQFEAMPLNKVVGGSAEANPDSSSKSQIKPAKVPEKLAKELHQFTVDLTAMAERGELDPVIGRDAVVRRVLEIIGRKKKNNPLLIGEPGVGKSAIAEAIALRIAEGAVPDSMRGKRVLSLDLGAMLAGAKYRGEFEGRLKNLLKALGELKGQVILFIDEIHMLVGAGNHEGGADAANLLKPALARGELQCLGATTLDEYRKYIEKDAAFERRFQPLQVEEPSRINALAIMRGLKSRYEIHHGVQIDDEALIAAVDLSLKYLTNRRLPDKAIDLIDEAASRLRLQIDSVPAILDELQVQIHEIEIERKAIGEAVNRVAIMAKLDVRLAAAKSEYERYEAIWRGHQELLHRMQKAESRKQELQGLYENAKSQGDFDFAARLQYDEVPRLERELSDVKERLNRLQKDHSFLRQVIGAQEIAEVVAAWTRVPVGRLMEDEGHKLLEMEERLSQRVFGQRAALETIARAVRRARVGVNDPTRPLGVFLFMGPTGVGKTETAKALAEELFSDESKVVRIDMSEFMEQHNMARLIGAPPGYVGFDAGGELTEAVRRKPYSVVLFDEIEKAHPKILDLLLQTFDDGRLTDGQGRTVDFRNTLMIMTSNLELRLAKDPELADDHELRSALVEFLRPELVNRIDEVVVFRRLGRKHYEQLLARLVEQLNQRLADRQLRISVGNRLQDRILVYGASGHFGGRSLRRLFETLVVDPVSDRILALPDLAHGAWTIDLDEDGGHIWVQSSSQRYLPPAPPKAD